MKIKFSIGLIFIVSMAIYLVYNSTDINTTQTDTLAHTAQIESVSSKNQQLKENGYYLCEKNGYVVVYLSDKKTPYEYTDILVSSLPYDLMSEIKNGKYVSSLNELYGFLENYSS